MKRKKNRQTNKQTYKQKGVNVPRIVTFKSSAILRFVKKNIKIFYLELPTF